MTSRVALMFLVLALVAGCESSRTPGALPPPEGDLSYLLTADPAAVSSAELLAKVEAADVRVRQSNVVEGIYWQALRHGNVPAANGYGSGGDSLLFTGNYLASCAYRYGVTKDPRDLTKAIDALRGIYILTHLSGTPGVLLRCAFPTHDPEPFGYPAAWRGRIAKGFVYDSPAGIDDPFRPGSKLPQMTFYTRVTRDQITGLIYGLSVYWQVVGPVLATNAADRARIEETREILARIVDDVYRRLHADDWKIRDQTGRNDTSADSVRRDLLRLALLSLYRHTVALTGDAARGARIQREFEDLFRVVKGMGSFPSDPFNALSNAKQYYAWNLRFTRASALWLNVDAADKPRVSRYIRRRLFKWVQQHKNAWFSFIYGATTDPLDEDVVADAVLSLKSWSLRPVAGWPSPLARGWGRPYNAPSAVDRVSGAADAKVLWPQLRKPTDYWTWQKDPWDADVTHPTAEFDGVGLDLLLPYWMARFHGMLP